MKPPAKPIRRSDSPSKSTPGRYPVERYLGAGGSGVSAFRFHRDGIAVVFHSGGIYLYSHASAGRKNIETMKQLARAGEGLSTFISQEVHDRYEKQLERI